MFTKKIIAGVLISALSIAGVSAATTPVTCDSDPSFAANSCNQCFTGGSKGQGDNIGFLSDEWINITDVKKIVFKEEQNMPYMVNLGGSDVSWKQTPSSNDFWEYTDEFNNLYDDENEGYVLEPGQRTTWIKSKLSYAYKLEKNTLAEGEKIGMLIYPITTHEILSNGELTIDGEKHRECVLYTSGEPGQAEVVETPERLPETGPAEYILLAILAMILGFGFLQVKNRV